MIDSSTSASVARHPAFRRMRGSVQEKMERLDEQLTEARAVYESELSSSQHAAMAVRSYQAQEASPAEVDLTPLLKEALDNLWNRPYDCRVFTLQLLQVIPVTSP